MSRPPVLRLDVDHDLGPYSFRTASLASTSSTTTSITFITTSPFFSRYDQTSLLRLDIAEHDDAVAERELGMGDLPSLASTTIFRAKPKTVHSQ